MASKEWDSIDEVQYGFEDYYCAFLDILGYKEKMNLFFQNKFNLYGRVQRAMHRAGVEPTPQDTPDGIISRIFSDSIILTAKKTDVHIGIVLNYIGQLVFWFGLEGLFLRGGLSYGKLLEDFGDKEGFSFLASEGLAKAYQMENQAIFPMIVLDENILHDIQDKKYIVKNGNKYMFNYVRYVISDHATNEDMVIKELQEIIEKKNHLADTHIREKYEWIINYYLWFIYDSHKKYGNFDLLKFKTFNNEINEKYVFAEYNN
ncbi:hypothetical protein FACS1894203_1110 [Bacteroidia bacterium]|nr:hypothetical protein FACS1894203_1110 [Bacteroidia bacterium]